MIEPQRDYTLSDSELFVKCGEVVQWMTRDEAEFTTRGVTVADRTAFNTLTTDFGDLDPDTYYMSLISEAVETKNLHKTEVVRGIQKISGFFEQQWGTASPQYRGLGIKGLARMAESSYLVAGKQVVRRAEERLTTLQSIGLTQADIDALAASTAAMDAGMDAVALAEENREEKRNERVIAGNELYASLVKYCMIGKLIWENVNEAKYNDYVIYKAVNSGLSKVQNFTAEETTPNVYALAWDPVVGATEYEVEFAEATTGQPQGPWQVHETTNGTTSSFQPAAGFTYWLRVRARNNMGQSGNYSDIVSIAGE